MKNNYALSIAILFITFVSPVQVFGQFYTNQLIIGNGGIYGNPSDNVSLASYKPDSINTNIFGDIQRESIQDMIIHDNYVYVTVEDSIVKFNIDTYEKIASVYESNLNQIFFNNGLLYVSRRSDINGPPSDDIYLKVFNAETLMAVNSIEGISGDAAGIVVEWDTIFVAVSGDWLATEGKLAVIDADYNLVREMNFGSDAVGIYDLFSDGNTIYSINRSPYGAISGSVTSYNIWLNTYSTSLIENVVGKGVAVFNNVLYLMLNNGIGSFDLSANEIIEASIIPDPGSSEYKYIADATFDHNDQLFYVTITDYYSMGEGKIYDVLGAETGVFDAGISAEAIALDFRINDFSFDDVEYWIGQGDKQALLVIDWNDSIFPESLAWGFRFNEELTGEDLLYSISEVDGRLQTNTSGGFLNDIIFMNGISHEGIGGTNGFYWGSWSGTGSGNWEINSGLSTIISDGDWFGCSFTDFNPAHSPGIPEAVSNPLGINDLIEMEISIFPNPATNFIKIEGNSLLNIELYNCAGSLIFTNGYNKNNEAILSLIDLPLGIYFVKIKTQYGQYLEKVIKT